MFSLPSMPKHIVKEVCVNSVQEAIEAQKRGASRIELCINLNDGGLSPSKEEIEEAHQTLEIPVFVMIRPRAGNFIYNEEEISEMKYLITICKEVGVEGVVFGLLTADNQYIDKENCKALVELAKGMQITFHRAFDEVKNPEKALEEIIDIGFHRVLTSGQEENALKGIKNIQNYIKQANGRLIILPGSGINKDNLDFFVKELDGLYEFHGSKIV